MSLIFTGAQYLSLASQVAKAFPFTFACWYKPATVAGSTPYCLITPGHTTTTVHFNTIQIANAKASISIPGASASSVASLTAGIWYHVVGVFSNANSKTVYLNGIGASTTVPSSLPTENITAIGAIFYGSSTTPIDFANGSIAYPSIWNLSLTQADVAALYNSGSGSDPRTVEPSNWLSFLTLTVGPPFVDQVSGSTWTSSGAPAVDTDPFSIPPVASPIMTVVGATNVQATMATLTGKLVFTRGGLPTVEGFHYGTTTGYGSTVQTTNAGGYAAGSFSLNVTGLAPATLYHFQSFSTNSGGTGVSADVFFTTATSWPPPGTPTLFNDRMGFACNFDLQGVEGNWVPATVIPLIANSGVGWVRDTINWSQFEPTAGNYVAYAPKVAWMTQFHTAGLKFCGLIQYPPLFYGNTSISPNEHWPLQETANFCAWLATTGIVDAIEVINEANNMTQFGGPANGGTLENLQALVALTNAVTASVHAVAPNMPVIGLNEQGSEVLYMLGQNPQLDGLVYHAYDLNDNIPENAYEPPYLNYSNWVKVVQGTTTLPIWETEGNTDPNRTGTPWGEYTGAVWLARRLLLSWWFDIAHFFIYTFTAGDLESSLDYFLGFRQQYWVLQRMLVALQGVSTTGGTVALSNLSDGLDASGVYSTVFCSRTSTLVSVWLGNNSASNPPVYGTADLSFTLLNTHVTDTIVDSVSGDVSDLSQYTTSSSGHTFTIHGFPVTDTPQLITISGATINAVPLVIAQMAVNPGVNSAVLIGSATYDGGSNITLTGFNVGLTTAYELIAFSIVQRGIGSFTSTVTGLQSGTT